MMNKILVIFLHNISEMSENSINKNLKTSSNGTNWWIWIAILEFVIIGFLIYKTRKRKKLQLKNDFPKEEIDFDNIIDSSFNSDKLYDELKIKCHPDRFPNNEKLNKIADELFQKISQNKNNSKTLLKLKKEAINKLNINF
ncbi:MAG TPA: LPXTG cell wall anchor domain-containing protein [Flavobacteriaceae bacterium]|nr:LPXTG cell wall anchor domain-containing protein [Flavobacteriaceae bacterium]